MRSVMSPRVVCLPGPPSTMGTRNRSHKNISQVIKLKIKIIRLETFPSDVPEAKIVGFQLTFQNKRTEFLEAVVDLNLSDEEAVEEALVLLDSQIESYKAKYAALPPLLGKEWEVSDEPAEIEEVEELEEFEDLEDELPS